MIFTIYDKNTFKCYFVEGQSIDDFKLKPNEAIKVHNSNDLSQTDIRAYNEDGTVKSLQEQVKENIITLKDNEIADDDVVRELNKYNEDDLIILIERGLEKLNDRQKIVINEDGKKYITSKSYEELFNESLITAEEYNQYIIQQRQGEYQSNLDGQRAELVDSVLNNLANQNLLTEEQKLQLESLMNKRQEIKTQYPKEN
uniref:phage tail protein n=1 Tax=Brachyspira catarrhinii TaxID=2528966 RepID=UPI003F4BE056